MMRRRAPVTSNVKYSKELQIDIHGGDAEESSSLVLRCIGFCLFLFTLWFIFFGKNSFYHKAEHVADEEFEQMYHKLKNPSEEVKEHEFPQDADEVGILINDEICIDRPHLLNGLHSTCEQRIRMIVEMGLNCDHDSNTLLSCCRTCEEMELTEHSGFIDDGLPPICVDRESQLQKNNNNNNDNCDHLMDSLFYLGLHCKEQKDAQQFCCDTCRNHNYWNDEVCEDYGHFLRNGDCKQLFYHHSHQHLHCGEHKEHNAMCCGTCAKLHHLYDGKGCLDSEYKLTNYKGTCKDAVFNLKKQGKTCDDDPELAETCCLSCSEHMKDGCHDSMFRHMEKSCDHHMKHLRRHGKTCDDIPSLWNHCCESCSNLDKCLDSVTLVRQNECWINVNMLEHIGETCDDDPEVKENCCASCTKLDEKLKQT